MTNNQSRMLGTHAHARHPRVAIGIGEVDISADNDVLIIRTARCQNERGKNHNFDSDKDAPNHALSQVRSPKKASPARTAIRDSNWARLDSNQGPRDYESPALPLSYRPAHSLRIKHSKSLVTNPESFRGCSTPKSFASGPLSYRPFDGKLQTPKLQRPRLNVSAAIWQ